MANGYLGHVPKFSTNKPEVIPAGTLNHTLEFAPGTPSALFVVVGGVPQEPNVAYTVSGKTLSFEEATPYDGWLVYRNKEGFSVGSAALADLSQEVGSDPNKIMSQKAVTDALADTLATAFSGDNQKLTVQGYQKLPGGLILQWGQHGGEDLAIATFPIAFPTACLNVSVTEGTTVSAAETGIIISGVAPDSYTRTNFRVRLVSSSGNIENSAFTWIAIGY